MGCSGVRGRWERESDDVLIDTHRPAKMLVSEGVERAAGPLGQVAREPGQSLTAAAISVVIFAVDVLVALFAPSPS
ncbi:MAG: hypothetical protein CMJ29_03925 [Phycisphaerae bacterium]|nr:hypothetical protein [Phycisphaerae bacterium]